MKFATILALTLFAVPAVAADLDKFGLGGMEKLDNADNVRGLGAYTWGVSNVSAYLPQYNTYLSSTNGYRSWGARKSGGENGSQLSVVARGQRGTWRAPSFCPPGWTNGVGNPHNCRVGGGRLPTIKIEAFAGGYSKAFSR